MLYNIHCVIKGSQDGTGEKTMKNSIDEYISYIEDVKKASNNTVLSYRRDLKRFCEYMVKNNVTSVDKITSTMINSYVLYLEREGKAAATVSRHIAAIRGFVNYLLANGKINGNPAENIRGAIVEKKVPKVLSEASVRKLVNAPDTESDKGIRDKAMLELMYSTGIKVSEIINLKCDEVNLDMSYIRCVGAKKERIIPFGEEAKNALDMYFKNTRGNLVKKSEIEKDYVFVNMLGSQMSRQGFWKMIKEYSKKAGIKEEITPNALRYFFGVKLVENGIDIRAVQMVMGYKDFGISKKYMGVGTKDMIDSYRRKMM